MALQLAQVHELGTLGRSPARGANIVQSVGCCAGQARDFSTYQYLSALASLMCKVVATALQDTAAVTWEQLELRGAYTSTSTRGVATGDLHH